MPSYLFVQFSGSYQAFFGALTLEARQELVNNREFVIGAVVLEPACVDLLMSEARQEHQFPTVASNFFSLPLWVRNGTFSSCIYMLALITEQQTVFIHIEGTETAASSYRAVLQTHGNTSSFSLTLSLSQSPPTAASWRGRVSSHVTSFCFAE